MLRAYNHQGLIQDFKPPLITTLEVSIPEKAVFSGYRNVQGRCEVYVEEGFKKAQSLSMYSTYCNKSPDGFNWGYGGSGPHQLAFAILMETMHMYYPSKTLEQIKVTAFRNMSPFVREFVELIPMNCTHWMLDAKLVLSWLVRRLDNVGQEPFC